MAKRKKSSLQSIHGINHANRIIIKYDKSSFDDAIKCFSHTIIIPHRLAVKTFSMSSGRPMFKKKLNVIMFSIDLTIALST